MTVKKILISDIRFFFFNSIDIHVIRLVLNFHTLKGKISIFITRKPQKNVNF